MRPQLDALFCELATQPPDRVLARLEVEVLDRVAQQRDARRLAAALAPVRVAAISLAAAIGLTAGGAAAVATASAPRQFDAFSVAGHLAPSTLAASGREAVVRAETSLARISPTTVGDRSTEK